MEEMERIYLWNGSGGISSIVLSGVIEGLVSAPLGIDLFSLLIPCRI